MGVAGHWCLLFMNRDKDHHPVVNYFDPTGHIPDGLITDMIPDEQDRKVMNADFTYLIDLLLKLNNQGLKIDYNQYPLQPPDTNGCGAFCTLRLLCKQMSTKEFASILMPIEPMKRELIVEKLWKIL